MSRPDIAPPASAAPASQAPARAGVQNDPQGLYRQQAVHAHLHPSLHAAPLRVAPPWAVAVVLVIPSIVATLLVLACLTHVDLTSRGRGILRARGGAQVLMSEVPGLVAEVHARSGDTVQANAPIVTLDSANMRAQKLEVESRLALSRATLAELEGRQMELHQDRIKMMKAHGRLLRKRIASQSASIARAKKKLRRYEELARDGHAAESERERSSEEVDEALRSQIGLKEAYVESKVQVTGALSDLEQDVFKARTSVREAEAALAAIELSMARLTIRAPRAGRLESLIVQPGDALAAGALVGKLVPTDAQLEIVAFVPERDRAFIHEGAEARVELDQLPVAEFGALTGIVTRVSTEMASAHEVEEALAGSAKPEPVYRVELSLKADAQAHKLTRHLRSGSLLSVRHALRKRRVITLVFEPLQQWFQ